jgi:hypothetical protein
MLAALTLTRLAWAFRRAPVARPPRAAGSIGSGFITGLRSSGPGRRERPGLSV